MKKYIPTKSTFWKCEFCGTILEFDDIINRTKDLEADERVKVEENYGATSVYLKNLCDCYSVNGRYYLLHREDIIKLLGRDKVAYTTAEL